MAEIIVTSTADSGAGSLRAAISAAQDGDVILFDADVFPQGQTTSILLSSYISINKSIGIYGGTNDGADGYTSGAVKSYYVYREIEDVKTKVVIASPDDAQEGETVLFELACRVALDGQEAVRCIAAGVSSSVNLIISGIAMIDGASTSVGGFYSGNSSRCTLNYCAITNCSGTNGGGVYSYNTSQNTLNGCVFDSCSATNGGGVYSTVTSQNTLNDCTFSNCSASNGGGVYSASTSQNTLNDCTFDGCSASQYGAVIYALNTSANTLTRCRISNGVSSFSAAVFCGGTSQNTLDGCNISNCSAIAGSGVGGVYTASTSVTTIKDCTITDNIAPNTDRADVFTDGKINIGGITTIGAATLNAVTIAIADGAALTITTSAAIGAATFTSAGRGYLAVASGINVSAATFDGVVLCAYGADVSSFAEVDGVLEWEAADPTTTVLIERADGDSWTTVTQTAGESLTLYLPPSDTVRLFDGVQFFTAQAPAVRTYYYIGGAEGSFTSAADWSLRRGGAAITEPPVVAGQRFIVGDISSGE